MQSGVAHDAALRWERGREQHRPSPQGRANRGELGGNMAAQRRVDLLEENTGALCAARCERPAHDAARSAFRPAAGVEIDRHDLCLCPGARVEQNSNLARAAEEGRGAVRGAGQVIRKDEDARQ